MAEKGERENTQMEREARGIEIKGITNRVREGRDWVLNMEKTKGK